MNRKTIFAFLFVAFVFNVIQASGQTTAFTYQGKLNDSGNPASGNYDFEFRLFDALSGGVQQGATVQLTNVAVVNGIFTVQLDFGACASCFNGAARFLDISVRVTGGGAFTGLAPRQPLTATPYAIKSVNAASADGLSLACVSCVTSSQIQSVNGSAVTGQISVASVPAGSANYIQNTMTPQAASNFNISGNGTVGQTLTGNIVSATTQFNIGGNRILSNAGSENLFAGAGAGVANASGFENAFFGRSAGEGNNSGIGNSFFGFAAGRLTTGGSNNSFFGNRVGLSNSTGNFNSFFGHRAGENNINGSSNSFFGTGAGLTNNGGSNSFFGHDAGNTNTTGSLNTVIGDNADVSINNLWNATAIGANALVSQSNSLILGSINGVNAATADTNVGIGTTAPNSKLHVSGTDVIRVRVDSDSNAGFALALSNQPKWSVATVIGGNFQIFNDALGSNAFWIDSANNNVGIGTTTPGDKLEVNGVLRVNALGTIGGTQLCRNLSNQIANCSSSIRYKTNIAALHKGLSLINRLHPVTFDWKQGGEHDLGLVAEEVANVEPRLVTHNDKGEIEGVKYDRVSVVLINAVKEQQAQIASQQEQIKKQGQVIEHQQRQLEALKRLVCSSQRKAKACK